LAAAPPQTPLGELTAPLRPVAGFKGPTSKGKEEGKWKGERRGSNLKGLRGGQGRRGRGSTRRSSLALARPLA